MSVVSMFSFFSVFDKFVLNIVIYEAFYLMFSLFSYDRARFDIVQNNTVLILKKTRHTDSYVQIIESKIYIIYIEVIDWCCASRRLASLLS